MRQRSEDVAPATTPASRISEGFARYSRLAHALGWVAVVVIGFLSLSPPQLRPVTGAPRAEEHLIAFFFLALLLCFGYREWRRALAASTLLIGYSAALELAQLWIPGRHSRWNDFIVSIAGIALGAVVAYAVNSRRASCREQQPVAGQDRAK